jgi:hypothetical protein
MLKRGMYKLAYPVLFLLLLLRAGSAADPDWSVILVGDPQNMADPSFSPNTVYNAMMQWIVANRGELNVKAVIGVGDIVNGCCESQMAVANSAWKLLDDAGIPWISPYGNHDLAGVENMRTPRALFDTGGFFAPAVRSAQPWYGGAKGTTGENWYITFEAESRKIGVIALEFFARPSAVRWAHRIHQKLKAEGYAVWIATHGWLNNSGLPNTGLPGEPYSLLYYKFTAATRPTEDAPNHAMSAVDAWNRYMRTWSNLDFIFGGHYLPPKSWDRLPVTSDSERHQTVQQIFQNFQFSDQLNCAGKAPCVYTVPPAPNPSNVAIIGILKFRPAAGLVEWSMMSTNSLNWAGADGGWHATQQIAAIFDMPAEVPQAAGYERIRRP